ncbi:CCR4-NOT transcription complex subunit 10 [Morella rubra]|uniref:CCR4-NOT transcription complex subunit 10 n=1 Tax=Morella rubra TaxID=262757 RepID=A0A6A1V813_9ROSI|nr:CCR4-NOT transcription complex subunit 10 [Morella rubra]
MDARDSSSSSSTTAAAASNRDGPSGTEDDAVLSVAAALAKEAALHFQSGKFVECVEVLNQLLLKKENDPKVFHNIAIAEYFRDGCSDPKKLLEALNNVKKRSEELACASGEQVESVSNLGNKAALGSKGSSTMAHQLPSVNSSDVVYTDECDTSVAILNIAVIWFHLHEYAKALSVLEPLYQNIEPIDETTALHICLLLLDVGLACNDASKCTDVLSYVERAFGVSCMSQGDNGSMTQQQSGNLVAKSFSVPPSSSSATDGSHSDLAAGVNASENSLSRTFSDETLEYETMLSTLDIGGQNSARPSGLSSSNDLARTPVDRSFTTVDLKLKLQLYKVQFLLLTRNLKQAKREVKHVMNVARGKDSSMALLLKSQIEYARGNHRKAIKLLVASSNRTDMAMSSIFNNNLGCIYFQLGKYHTSSIFFSKALTNTSSLRKEKPQKLSTFSQDNSFLIIYNCGVQYLACGNPILAARCFQKASLVFYNRPLLWLRLAECCLMALEKGLITTSRVLSERSEVRVHVVGQGKWRQLVMEDGISRSRHMDSVEREDFVGQPKLSMLLARQCLQNALHLLNGSELNHSKSDLPSYSSLEENESSEADFSKDSNRKNLHNIDSKAFTVPIGLGQVNANGDAKEPKGGTNQEFIQNSLSYYEDVRRKENHLMKQAILADLAFVELELENPMKALLTSRSLLDIPECSRIYIFLSHVYAAEALCLLNRPKEGAEHLSIYLSGGNNIDLPFSEEDCEQWRVERTIDSEELNGGSMAPNNSPVEDVEALVFLKPEEARATLYANFAAMSAMQGELEQAHQFVTQALSILPNSKEATLTSIYVDLMLGKSREALARLKQCSRARFLTSGVTLNKSS